MIRIVKTYIKVKDCVKVEINKEIIFLGGNNNVNDYKLSLKGGNYHFNKSV